PGQLRRGVREGVVRVAMTELIQEGGIEGERARTPPQIDTDGVTLLLVSRSAWASHAIIDEARSHEVRTHEGRRTRRATRDPGTETDRAERGAVADDRASRGGRRPLEPRVGIDGTDVEALERGDLDAGDDGEVVTAVEAEGAESAGAWAAQARFD